MIDKELLEEFFETGKTENSAIVRGLLSDRHEGSARGANRLGYIKDFAPHGGLSDKEAISLIKAFAVHENILSGWKPKLAT
ncbi:MAG: hypothetical protein ABIJ27_00545 [Candidatus Omnitrophota bacterium]